MTATAEAGIRHHTGVPHLSSSSWVGVDWDGTLVGQEGRPVQAIVHLVKNLISAGVQVKIFSARASEKDPFIRQHGLQEIIHACRHWFGQELPITCEKDKLCYCLIDDRAVAVVNGAGAYMDPNHLVGKLLGHDH